MPAPDRRGVQSLIERLGREQAEANAELAPLVESGNLGALDESLEQLVIAAREAGAR